MPALSEKERTASDQQCACHPVLDKELGSSDQYPGKEREHGRKQQNVIDEIGHGSTPLHNNTGLGHARHTSKKASANRPGLSTYFHQFWELYQSSTSLRA